MNQTTGEKPAKLCYNHIGGKPGAMLLALFVDKGWIAKDKPTDKHFNMTGKGEKTNFEDYFSRYFPTIDKMLDLDIRGSVDATIKDHFRCSTKRNCILKRLEIGLVEVNSSIV